MMDPICDEKLVFLLGKKKKKTSKEYFCITHAAECNILAIKKVFQLVN